MPFYFRKSISAGPFRFNFSKGGVGASVGIKGLRIGTGPRGHYVHASAGGINYRSSIGRAGQAKTSKQSSTTQKFSQQLKVPKDDNVVMQEIESSDVLAMTDSNFEELLAELNIKQAQISMAKVFAWCVVAICLVLTAFVGATALTGLILVPIAIIFGKWIDSFRKSSVVFYELDKESETNYKAVTSAFDELMSSEGKWHVEAAGDITSLTTSKRNAGANRLVAKNPTVLSYCLPKVLNSNITPPSATVGKQTIYFLPDGLLVEEKNCFGAVGYDDLKIDISHQQFIEEGTVPNDATVVGQTWKHPNKNGGPDKRFRNNYQIPVCLYEQLHLSSNSGLNELLEFSKLDKTSKFVAQIRSMPLRT